MSKVSGDSISLGGEPPLVLLVEDNLVNQKVALVLLDLLGLRAEVASNGKEAVAAVKERDYDLILMDCHMPEMDGFEATVAIRKLEAESGRYTPILAVTALAMAGDRERCIGAGMDDYVPKPIDKDLLQSKVNQWLQTAVSYDKGRRKVLRTRATLTLVDNEPINLKELEEFYGQDQMTEMLDIFVKHAEMMLKHLRPMISNEKGDDAQRLAHELKASCASIGAKQLAKLCLYLEQAVGQRDWIEAEETLSSFERSFANMKSYIESAVPV